MNRAQRSRRSGWTRVAVSVLALATLATVAPPPARVLAVETGEEALVMTTELYRPTGYNLHFGQDIAIEGDIMVVGGHTGDDNVMGNCGEGLAYVYQRVNALEWQEIAQLTHSEPFECATELQAFSVDIEGDWIALGAPLMPVLLPGVDPVDPEYPQDYNHQGAVLLYHKPAGGWQDAVETLTLTEFDGSKVGTLGDYYEAFGADVAFDGEDLVVGAPAFDLDNVPDTGAVFVYRQWLDGWEPAATLAGGAGLRFGASVDASEGTIAVGTRGRFYGGTYAEHGAYLFEKPVEGWASTGTPSASFDVPAQFGTMVALDGQTLVAVLPDDGLAYVVEGGPGGWDGVLEPSAQLEIPTVWQSNYSTSLYGADIEGETIVLGRHIADDEAGEAYVYERPADGWGVPGEGSVVTAVQALQQPDPNRASGTMTGDRFGASVAIEGGVVAIGADWRWHPTFDTGEMNHSAGSVFVYETSTDHEAPQTSFVLEPAEPTGINGWYDEPLTLSIATTDAGSGTGQVRCALVTGGSFASYDQLPPGSCPYLNGASIPEGEWFLFAASVDAAGNRGPVVSKLLKVDYTDPTAVIELSPPEPNGPNGIWLPPLYVRLNALENELVLASGWCTLDPAVPPTTYEELRALPFCGNDFWTETGREYTVDETHTIYVAAIDRAGNTSPVLSQSYSVGRRPQVSIGLSSANPPSSGWYRGPVTVTVTGTSASGQPATETRCVLDPAVVPSGFDDMAASCPFAGGAAVTASGSHAVYAASRDSGGTSTLGSATFRIDATQPTLTCEGTGPAQFVIGEAEGTLTARVSDAGSGPATSTVTLALDPEDLATAGSKTATLRGLDVAGNEGTVSCAYTVGYGIEVVAPTPGAAYRAGTTVPLTFRLVDADGVPIADTVATSLLGGKRGAGCRIVISLDDAAQRGCPTYTASTDLFSFGVKTPKSRSAVGIHDIGIEVRASDGRTVLSFARVAFQLT